jgi:hypothetical protein
MVGKGLRRETSRSEERGEKAKNISRGCGGALV